MHILVYWLGFIVLIRIDEILWGCFKKQTSLGIYEYDGATDKTQSASYYATRQVLFDKVYY